MSSERWGDLKARVLSAIAMLVIGIVAIWQGGVVFAALAVVVSGLMVWELAAMTAREQAAPLQARLLGVVAALALAVVLYLHSPFVLPLLALPAVLGALQARRDRVIFAAYAFAAMLAGYGLVALREGQGVVALAWVVAIVVTSDVAGYFAGRILGGPKFWPRVSPKKTWSGTVAGWIGAVAVGAVFMRLGMGAQVLWLSPILAFAGQMGDIAESAIKRRTGVKDSSNLIPGHGGVLDRFDALLGAILVLLLLFTFGGRALSGV